MKLLDILKDVDFECNEKIDSVDIESIEYDSRNVRKNSAFICIKGFSIDGHKFANKAVENGATVLIVEDVTENIKNLKSIVVKVKNTRSAMAKLASNFYNNPSKKLKLVGVTGTNGKTTISYLIKDFLDQKNKCGIIGTIKTYTGTKEIESSRTTPESIDLQSMFKEMIFNNILFCAIEVSSHSLVLNRVDECDFDIGIFTNLTPDHLDFHKDMQEYKEAKALLFQKTSKSNILNIDDEAGFEISQNLKYKGKNVISYAIEKDADFKAKNINLLPDRVEYKLEIKEKEYDVVYKVPGKFSVYNSLAAIASLIELNQDINEILNFMKNYKGVPGRFNRIENNKNICAIVDYAHTPDALKNVLESAREFTKGKLISVFGCGGNRDKKKRPLMGAISEKLSDISIVTSDNPRNEIPNEIINDILEGMNKNSEKIIVKEDRREAIVHALSIAQEGDTVIVAGKGHEDYQIIGDEKIHFDDTQVIKEFLED